MDLRKDGIDMSREQKLLNWCRKKKLFSKAQVIAFGVKHYYLRADRTVRDFVQEGKLRRLDKEECVSRNLKGNMAWYEFVTDK